MISVTFSLELSRISNGFWLVERQLLLTATKTVSRSWMCREMEVCRNDIRMPVTTNYYNKTERLFTKYSGPALNHCPDFIFSASMAFSCMTQVRLTKNLAGANLLTHAVIPTSCSVTASLS